MIFDMISWYKDKDDICNHVIAMEKEIEGLKKTIKHNQDYLYIMPSVVGKRYKDIYVPTWFQLVDDEKLLTDFKAYIKEAYASKRLL